jgi:hypothetical protein
MKKIVLALIAFIALVGLCYADDLSIESVSIDPATNNCQSRWHATIRNNGSGPLSASTTVQGIQYVGSHGYGAGGTAISSLAPGETIDKSLSFSRKAGVTSFQIVIRQGSQEIAQSQVTLPPEPAPNLSIASVDFRNNGYTITVRNNNPVPITEVGVQAYMATAQAPNSWSPIGGGTIMCIGSNSTGQRNTNRPSGWNDGYTRYKVLVRRGTTTLVEKIFDLTPPQGVQSTTGTITTQQNIVPLDKKRIAPKRIRPPRRR